MSAIRIVAIVLIVAGVAGLAMGRVSYTQTTHAAKVGPFHLALDEKKTVNIPLWAGIAAVLGGVAMLVVPRRAVR